MATLHLQPLKEPEGPKALRSWVSRQVALAAWFSGCWRALCQRHGVGGFSKAQIAIIAFAACAPLTWACRASWGTPAQKSCFCFLVPSVMAR